jgi:hypothetical protein
MKYLQKTFTLPSGGSKLTDDDYDLAVGKITQKEFERRQAAKKDSSRKTRDSKSD